MILESCIIDEGSYDAMTAQLYLEVNSKASGPAGPRGGQGVMASWGYWWAQKDAHALLL